MSCIDCGVKNCDKMNRSYPDFCLMTHMGEEVLTDAMACYEDETNHKIMVAALYTADTYYSKLQDEAIDE